VMDAIKIKLQSTIDVVQGDSLVVKLWKVMMARTIL
jgi:hypothetical protein